MSDMLPNGTTVIENPQPKPEAPAGYPYLRRKDADIFYIWTPGFAAHMLPATAEEYQEWRVRKLGHTVLIPTALAVPVAPLGQGTATTPPAAVVTAAQAGSPADPPPPPAVGKCAHDVPFGTFCATCKALGKPTAMPAALPSQGKAKTMNATQLHALVLAVTGCPAGADMSRKDMLNILFNDGKPPEPKA